MMAHMDPALVHRLASGEGWGLLQSLPPYDETQVVTTTARLREAGFDPELVAAALTQSRLRARAAAKFGAAAHTMLFTEDGLEQATRLAVATRHAERLVASGVRRVWDLGCGIGADAMAMARAGLEVVAVEADPTTAAVAAVNLRPWPHASVRTCRAEDVVLPTGETARHCAVWFDPARRVSGVRDVTGTRARRLFRLDQLSPDWDLVQELAVRVPAAGAKLSPAFPHHKVPPGAEAQWTSFDGEAVECAIWWGAAAHRPGRSAQVHTGTDWVVVHEDDEPGPAPLLTGPAQVRRWLYEPDRAVLQAGLVGSLAARVDGAELDSGVGYVTADRATDLPWARRWHLVEVLPLHPKTLRAWARGHDVGRLTLKKRGVRVDVDDLRGQLRLRGSREEILLLTRIGGRPFAVHLAPAEPLPPHEPARA